MAELAQDHETFKSPTKLRSEGALLIESAGSAGGRVVFSLQEIPLRRKFLTSNGNFIRRDKDDVVSLWSADSHKVISIPISQAISTQNKDYLFWAHSQNDLLLFDDAKHLASTGAMLTEPISGRSTEIRALTDIPIGVKYFTEHGNIIQRNSPNEILLGDKILYVNPPPSDSGSFSNTPSDGLSDDEKFEDQFAPIKGKSHLDDDFAPTSREDVKSEHFPRALDCALQGRGYHLDDLQFNYVYKGGVEGNSIVRWERCTSEDEGFIAIVGAKGKAYRPTIEDIGTVVRVACTPVRADGVTGAVVYSNTVSIQIDPEVAEEVYGNLALSTLLFKVLMSNGGDFQKRSIALSRDKIKIRKRRTTITKARFGEEELSVLPSVENDCSFTLGFGADEFYSFLAPSCYQRDIIVLTIQSFNVTVLNGEQ